MIVLFERFGLKTNELKTKFMILRGAEAPRALEDEVYDKIRRRGRGVRMRFGEKESWAKQKVTCEICGKTLARGSLQRHMETMHGERRKKYGGRKKGEGGGNTEWK